MSKTDFYPLIKYPAHLERFAKEQQIELVQNNCEKRFQIPKKILSFPTYNLVKLFNVSIWFLGVGLIIFLRLSLVWLLAFVATFVVIDYWLHNQLREDKINQSKAAKNNLKLFNQAQNNYRAKSLLSYLKSHPPLQGIGIVASQRGVSEAFFLNYLEQFLPAANISWKMEFAIPSKLSFYSVDFLVVDPQTGLSLIIEIDEPYISKNKFESYHYLDSSDDDQTDNFLVAHNLIVLRFAEEQIVRYPHSCCLVIVNILWQLTGNTAYLHGTNQIKPLPLIKRWTRFKTRKMWKRNYRQKYLAETGVAYFSPSEYKFARRYQKSKIKKISKW